MKTRVAQLQPTWDTDIAAGDYGYDCPEADKIMFSIYAELRTETSITMPCDVKM